MEMRFCTFKRKYNVKLSDIRYMAKIGLIEIFQQGYRGHSTRHPKKIRILDLTRLELYLWQTKKLEEEEHEYEQSPQPMVSYLTKNNIYHEPKKHRYPKKENWFDERITSPWILSQYMKKEG